MKQASLLGGQRQEICEVCVVEHYFQWIWWSIIRFKKAIVLGIIFSIGLVINPLSCSEWREACTSVLK